MTVLGLDPVESGQAALRLQSDPSELPRARRFANDAAVRFGLSRAEIEDFRLAASEAVANAIEHGSPCVDGAIHVWTSERPGTLTLGVRNGGEFTFGLGESDRLAERGRGLDLMADLVDVVALTHMNGQTQIEITKQRVR